MRGHAPLPVPLTLPAMNTAGLEEAVEEAPPSGWAATTFEAFRFPSYRLVWFGSFLGYMAFTMASTAQSVVAYDLTGNNRAVGTVMFGQGIAMTFLNPFGGAIADRFSKRFLMILGQAVIGSVMLTTAVLISLDRISIAYLASASFLVGIMFSFLGPARTAILGEVLPGERIGNAMALFQVGNNFARVAAPFLAGSLLAWPLVGSAGTYFLIASLFVFIIATFSQVPGSAPRQDRAQTSVLQDVRIGFRYLSGHPRLLRMVLGFHVVMILGSASYVVLPAFAKDVLDAGTAGLGVLLGVSAAGGFVMSLAVASLADSRRAPFFLLLSSFSAGVALVLTGLAPSFAVAVLTMAMASGGVSAFQTLNNAIALRLTDRAYYGRVIGLVFIAWGFINLVSLPMGALADFLGERAVLSGSGAALCLFVGLLALWQRRGREGPAAGSGSPRG